MTGEVGRARPYLVVGLIGAFLLMAVAIVVAIGGVPKPSAEPSPTAIRMTMCYNCAS